MFLSRDLFVLRPARDLRRSRKILRLRLLHSSNHCLEKLERTGSDSCPFFEDNSLQVPKM